MGKREGRDVAFMRKMGEKLTTYITAVTRCRRRSQGEAVGLGKSNSVHDHHERGQG